MRHHESEHQSNLIYWAKLATAAYPDLAYMHCSLNGVQLTSIQAKLATANGMKKGVLDLFLPAKRGQYSGCYIEMKYGKNKLTIYQENFMKYVISQGFYVCVCYSWDKARDELINYLKLPTTANL